MPARPHEAVLTVQVTTGLVPPVANPGGPYFGSINVPMTLDRPASYTPNPSGSIAAYAWDLDGNGTYETVDGGSPTVAHTWTTCYLQASTSRRGA